MTERKRTIDPRTEKKFSFLIWTQKTRLETPAAVKMKQPETKGRDSGSEEANTNRHQIYNGSENKKTKTEYNVCYNGRSNNPRI